MLLNEISEDINSRRHRKVLGSDSAYTWSPYSFAFECLIWAEASAAPQYSAGGTRQRAIDTLHCPLWGLMALSTRERLMTLRNGFILSSLRPYSAFIF